MHILHPRLSFQSHSSYHISHPRSCPLKVSFISFSTFFLRFTAGLSLLICNRTTSATSLRKKQKNKMHSNSTFALFAALSLAAATPIDYSLQARGNTPSKPADIKCAGGIIGYRTVTIQVRYCSLRRVSFWEKHGLRIGLVSVKSNPIRNCQPCPKSTEYLLTLF